MPTYPVALAVHDYKIASLIEVFLFAYHYGLKVTMAKIFINVCVYMRGNRLIFNAG